MYGPLPPPDVVELNKEWTKTLASRRRLRGLSPLRRYDQKEWPAKEHWHTLQKRREDALETLEWDAPESDDDKDDDYPRFDRDMKASWSITRIVRAALLLHGDERRMLADFVEVLGAAHPRDEKPAKTVAEVNRRLDGLNRPNFGKSNDDGNFVDGKLYDSEFESNL